MQKLKNFLQSFGYAFAGIGKSFCTQRNIQIQIIIAVVVVLLGGWLQIPVAEWAILALTIGVVLTAELINTAIETVVDLVSPEHHSLAKTAKDAAAGAVLVSAVASIVVGAVILGPRLWERLTW